MMTLTRLKLLLGLLCLVPGMMADAKEVTIPIDSVTSEPERLRAQSDDSRTLTWWLPSEFDVLTLPIAGGVRVDWSQPDEVRFLKDRTEWDLKELPILGARYGERTLAVYVPYPHYASIVTGDRVGIRFSFPAQRNNTTPCDLVVQWTGNRPLDLAKAFRGWRRTATDIGEIPRPRPLDAKERAFPKLNRLYGAAHFYLWGNAGFSHHDVHRRRWVAFAKALLTAPDATFAGRLRKQFSSDQLLALKELAASDWPMKYLTVTVAAAIDGQLNGSEFSEEGERRYQAKRELLMNQMGAFLKPVESWGDGLSSSLLDELNGTGIRNAVLVLSDLYRDAQRSDVVARAKALGYFVGPYDSYHSVHSPEAGPDDTWETAQFDQAAFRDGRVIKEQGRRQGGFKGRGFHFAPEAAWPYVQARVHAVKKQNEYTAWFVDCDATGECFDDYSSLHVATRLDDVRLRRQRLQWLEHDEKLLVGSEGGSILFADVIHFGHGVHTPYIGHLAPGFRNRKSPHFLGRHWPPNSPEQSFMPVPVPEALKRPYFDPLVRVPLYQAVLGDELVATHHWSFDSLKLKDVAATRALLEILYAVPPMYHINRETWEGRKEQIVHHLGFWSPLHKQVAPAELNRFEYLTESRSVQRTHFSREGRPITVTVNFSSNAWGELPARSAKVTGVPELEATIYQAR